MLTFTAMAWGGDAIDGVSLIDLRQKLKDITAQQALLLDQVLEHMDDEILNAQLKAKCGADHETGYQAAPPVLTGLSADHRQYSGG